MAVYRNKSEHALICVTGFYSPREVAPDETVEVPDEVAENYDLNDNFVRVDGAPKKKAPAE